VPFDRAATLRNAEKFLRQGKLDSAIAEYLRIVEDQPRDLNAANTLGDLYQRAGKTDKAIEQFIRIADSLTEEGFLSKAAALYKKVLKLRPDDEHALMQGAEIAASQGLLADARTYLNAVADRRRNRKDVRGVAQIQIRLGSLDPEDYEARRAAAAARIQIEDLAGGIEELKNIAAELAEKGRPADAIAALTEAAKLGPDDREVHARLLDAFVETGDFARARQCATTADELRALATTFESKGHDAEALSALCDAARLAPDDADLKARLARTFVARGEMARAAEYLTVETAGSDPALLMMLAEMHLRGDQAEQGLAVVRRILAEDPSRREQIAIMGWTLAETVPEVGFRTIEMAADAAVAQSDWASAAAALQEFVTRVPNHIPALMRLVEICVDGGLEATMYSAQAQLADAYIAAGSAAEALVIAEDLVAREPWERSNVERFRRALELMGEPDPEGVIAERLSGQSPFTSTDLTLLGDLPDFEPHEKAPAPPPAPPVEEPAPPAAASTATPPVHSSLEPADGAEHEIDLTISLDSLDAEPDAPPEPEPEPQPRSDNLDGVFERLRSDAAKRTANEQARQAYVRGTALHESGDLDGAIAALKEASRAPSLRFEAASLLARIYRKRGVALEAIEWFERAAEAPAPTADDAHLLLYELADTLESSGEVARALAIFMALQSEADGYRDVGSRVDRLSKVQARG